MLADVVQNLDLVPIVNMTYRVPVIVLLMDFARFTPLWSQPSLHKGVNWTASGINKLPCEVKNTKCYKWHRFIKEVIQNSIIKEPYQVVLALIDLNIGVIDEAGYMDSAITSSSISPYKCTCSTTGFCTGINKLPCEVKNTKMFCYL